MSNKRKSLLFGISARVLMMIAAGLLAVSYLSVLVNPGKAWLLTLFGLLFVPLLLLNGFLLAWATVRRSKAIVIPLLALLPAIAFTGRFVQFGGEGSADVPVSEPLANERTATGSAGRTKGSCVRMVTYNVGRFSPERRSCTATRADCLDSVAAYLSRLDADIVCLQEFYVPFPSRTADVIASHFQGYTPVYYMYSGKKGMFGNVILTRLPVRGKGAIKFEESSNLAVYADIEMAGAVTRVYNCHLESYNISLSGIAKSLRRDYRAVVHETGLKMKASIARRPRQVLSVMADIEKSPVDAIVCGDLNDGPVSYTYHRLCKGRRDSFREAGHGFGATYSMLWPLLRIDYLFYPKGFAATSHKTPHAHWSDHYPVIVTLVPEGGRSKPPSVILNAHSSF